MQVGISPAGDYEEAIERYAKHLGKNQMRRLVFDEIYGRVKKPRSKKQIMDAAGIENKKTNSQQVQNALEYLYKHHLIERHDNNGKTSDGSRYIYSKAEFIRANKEKIVRYADNPKSAAALPTKRRSVVHGVQVVRQVTKRSLKNKKRLTILYLAANPDPASPLRVDAEVRRVQEAIQRSKFRENINVEYRPAADLKSLVDGLNTHRPQIVHFSGHGNEAGIATDTGQINGSAIDSLSFDLLGKALNATDKPPQVVILNSCKSSSARKALLPVAKIIVTMRVPVTDIAAAAFAENFYAAIAAGQSVKSAFAQGQVAVENLSIMEARTPELLHGSDVDPSSIILT